MYFDLLLLILMIFFAIRGAMTGLVAQIFSLVCWLLIIVASPTLATVFQHQNMWPWLAAAPLAVLWIFAALSLMALMTLIEWITAMARKNPKPTTAARWIGAGLGLVKGFVVVLLIGTLLHMIPTSLRGRFPDFDRDFGRSKFLSMSGAALTWDSIRFFGSLKSVQERLKESALKRSEESHDGNTNPWIPEVNANSE